MIHSTHETGQSDPADLVFNFEEVGISDWEVRQPKKFCGRSDSRGPQIIPHRISRNVKDISAVTWISADEAFLPRSMVTSQNSVALHRALEATEMQIGRDLFLRHRDKPSVKANLFENNIRTVFLPDLASTRAIQNFREEEAVLLTANCSPRRAPIVIELLSTACVRVVIFAPNTT
jgi:hypothetical protein